jgi:hypothetical protein
MPVIPILLNDTARQVEYKIQVAAAVADEQDALANLATWRNYYSGAQPLLLSEDQSAFVAHVLSSDGSYPIDNKIKTVVNKLRRRVNVQGFVMPDMPAVDMRTAAALPANPANSAEWAWRWWNQNKMDSGERELYKSALRDGWAYIVVSHDGTKPVFHVEERWDGTNGIRFFWDNDRLRRTPLYAVKYWHTKDPLNIAASIERVTLYTASAVYKWARFADARRQGLFFNVIGPEPDDTSLTRIFDDDDNGQWPLPWTDGRGAPMGLAVVPFVAPMGSVVDGLIGLQDALNKTWVDIVVNADQQGFGQFVAQYPGALPNVSTTETSGYGAGVTDDDGYGLRPGRVLELGGGATMNKLPADDMTGLHNTARIITTAIAANSEMPLHYFIPLSGEVPSGAALDELSKPVGELAQELCVGFGDAWREVMVIAQKLDNQYGAFRGEPQQVAVQWMPQPKSPETEASALQPLEAATRAIQNLVASGSAYEAAAAVVGGLMGLSRETIDLLVRGDVVDGVTP